ncbi:MpaA3 family daptide-type RiPP [Microbacterium enclense]|nr:MpaA3 family daptide-type RiPP [Microbacterium enclense]
MSNDLALRFDELDELDAPMEWWEHASYIIAIAAATVAIAT